MLFFSLSHGTSGLEECQQLGAFFRRAIDIGRQKLPMPVQLLGRVRLVINVDRDCSIHLESRRVSLAGLTKHPTAE